MDPKFAISGRALGEILPISVSTAVAIEALPEKRSEWGAELWINVRTLLRNMWSTIQADDKRYVGPEHLYEPFKEEMRQVANAVRDISGGTMAVVYYHCRYDDLVRWVPNGVLKEPTELQKGWLAIEHNLMSVLLREDTASGEFGILQFNTEIVGRPKKVLLMTHYPIDLLFAKSFAQLQLLESHTGTIKGRGEWNTKLTGGKLLTNIPFNRFTLQVFGDNNNLLNAMGPKIKKVVVEMAATNKWTSVSSMELVRFSIQQLKDPIARDFLLKVAKA